ncbi:tryptophan synthase subunit alpha [Campylobacter sp. MIT 12-5580]|uniref:tryptophan synthase subunit alpha n=1 Tax=Campylobacter sp. MIT 12-5580 TaxID=2040651 RepID=UPI0010F8D934|nr:tryptophan synthase subunit alpha [Campylobacter sp. MIT 12-5580]TKX30230.1 tryptophan synthase subunit alpha [Campylobacter sp. MIT 12-5580]
MVDFKHFYKEKANVAFSVFGYPNLATTKAFLQRLDTSKIDILELGIAYSDPIADGRIISEAALQALNEGINIHEVFKSLTELKIKKPIVFLVYYNLIFSYGIKQFVEESKKVGIKGLIVPELPFEENEELFRECEKAGLALIPLISVTTSKERMQKILTRASGFVYVVASLGITGGKQVGFSRLKSLVKELRAYTTLPIFIGFGIKNAKDVQNIKQICDGAIVGTSIVEAFKEKKITKIMQKVNEIF